MDALQHGIGARLDARRRPARARRSPHQGRWFMDTLRYDLRHAVRLMLRQPSTTAIIVCTMALAIGANTAVFSAVHAVLLRPLPYERPGELAMLWEKRPAEGVMTNVVSPADFLDWARLNQSFTAIAAYTDSGADLTGIGEPERIRVAGVSAPYFDIFRVRALHGRTFQAGEDVLGRHRVVVLSHALWRQRFGGDPAVVGTSIMLNGLPQQVIGVLPPDLPLPGWLARGGPEGDPPQLYAPLVLQGGADPPSRVSHQFFVYGRLKPGVTLEQARDDMDRIGRDLEAQYPTLSRGHGSHVTRLDEEIAGPVRGTLLMLLSAVGFVLLIACINVTNLLLARAAGRRREMAVRSAIGANRGRLIRQALVECTLLAIAGSAAGLVLAVWGGSLLAAQMPAVTRPDTGAVFSVPVLLFTLTVSVVAGVLAGALPAWHAVQGDPAEPLKEGGRGPVSLRRRLRQGLIVSEVALTSLLLVGAGLALRSFQQVLGQSPGFDTASRLTLRVALPGNRYQDRDSVARFWMDLDQRLSALPTVRAAGATSALPLSGADGRRGVVVDGYERGPDDPPTRAHGRQVTVNYLPAIGATVVQGRGLLPSDHASAPPVILINETMARRYWPGRSPIGTRIRWTDQETWREVVGVVADIKHWALDGEVNPETYSPIPQEITTSLTFVLHTDGDPTALVPAVQRNLLDLDPNLPLFQVRSFDEVAARSIEQRRWTMVLLASFAVLALVLAGAGIYGVMSHLVSLRTSEIGIRLTLGAKPAAVMRQVLREGLLQTALGLSIGLLASQALVRGMQAILFGVEGGDPLTLAAVGATLTLVALGACVVPALRAMRVDPVTALRA
jgi:putative ABC transport system permease protein